MFVAKSMTSFMSSATFSRRSIFDLFFDMLCVFVLVRRTNKLSLTTVFGKSRISCLVCFKNLTSHHHCTYNLIKYDRCIKPQIT